MSDSLQYGKSLMNTTANVISPQDRNSLLYMYKK